jgi:hypothetical protein
MIVVNHKRCTDSLRSIDEPSAEIIVAVQGTAHSFYEARLTGIREITKKAKGTTKGWGKVVAEDASAPPIWAYF